MLHTINPSQHPWGITPQVGKEYPELSHGLILQWDQETGASPDIQANEAQAQAAGWTFEAGPILRDAGWYTLVSKPAHRRPGSWFGVVEDERCQQFQIEEIWEAPVPWDADALQSETVAWLPYDGEADRLAAKASAEAQAKELNQE